MKRSRSPKAGLSVVYQRHNGAIVAFQVRGHAGFAQAGRDIVCAAVSALILSAVHGLRAHCAVAPAVADSPALYAARLRNAGNAKAQAVLETLISGLEAIAKSYPRYLSVRQGRVPAF